MSVIVNKVKSKLQNIAKNVAKSIVQKSLHNTDYAVEVADALENSKLNNKTDLEHKLEKDELTKIFNSQYNELKIRFNKLDNTNKSKNYEHYNGVIIPNQHINNIVTPRNDDSKVEET